MKSTIFSKTGQPQISADFGKVFFPPVFAQAVIESVGRGTLARGTLVQNVLSRYYNKAFWTPAFAGDVSLEFFRDLLMGGKALKKANSSSLRTDTVPEESS
jgi:hypothetical protein